MASGVRYTIGIIGARGHVGAELIGLIAAHPRLELAFVSSRELAGQPVRTDANALPSVGGLATHYENLGPEACAARGADVVILAMPNDKAAPFVAALDDSTVVVDLSADYRFDESWHYGLPELFRRSYAGERHISNPGCYATAMQLAIAPMLDLLAAPTQCFGVSGYSGAGTTPSDRNDPEKLRDNLMPYSLAGHVHEREVTRHLHHDVQFLPHVAAHFRGITMTVNMHLRAALSHEQALQRYQDRYGSEPLVRIAPQAPWVSGIAGAHHVEIGGFTLADEGRRLVAVAVLDNLLKGAATQALQNVNIALGLPELEGIHHG